MEPNQINESVENKPNGVNRNQRRTDNPQIEHDVLGMARRTRSLRKTCTNLCLTQAQVLFLCMIQLADVLFRSRDGFGAPIVRKPMDQAGTADSRRFEIVSRRAA